MGNRSSGLVALLASVGLGACGTPASLTPARPPNCSTYAGFALSLGSDRGGQASPMEAGRWFAVHGGVAKMPSGEWSEANRNGQGATIYSGKTILHVLRGPDGTWKVDSGRRCS